MRFRDWVTALGAFAALAVAIFAVGGVVRSVQAVVAVLVAIAFGFTTVSRRGLSRVSPLVAALGTACVLTAVQLLPLPEAVLAFLSPVGSAMRADGTALVGVEASHTLTTDVPGTLAALVFFLTLLGLAFVALRMSTSERGRYRVIACVAGLCGLTAAVVGVHVLFHLQALYGFYEPHHAQPILLGPLLNANSLACLMTVGAMLSIGLAAYRRQPGWLRVVWLLVVAGGGAITVTTVSRGASLAFGAGALVTLGVIVGQRLMGHEGSKRRRVRFLTNAMPIGVVAGCMVLLVILANAGNVERQLSQLSIDEFSQSRSKFVAWRSAATLVEESPWLGVGRGAFESTFTRIHPASGVATYGYLENEYLQAIVDWGVPGSIVLACMLIWFAFVAIRRWRDGPLAAGALGALTVVAIQSNVDFGLEMLGLAAPVVAIAATLAYVPLRELTRRRPVQLVRGSLMAALVVGALLLISSRATTLDEDRRALANRANADAVRASIARHPLDYYSYAVAAEMLEQHGDARAIHLLNQAMLLHPTHPVLHQMAARMLYREGFIAQSTIEYAAAMRTASNPKPLVAEILARFPRQQAAAAFPVDYLSPELLVTTITELERPDVATLWLARVLEQRPRDSRACDRLFALAQRGESAAADVAGKHCVELLPDYQTRLALAQILAKQQGHEQVINLLADIESWQSRVDDKINAWLVLCDSHVALGHVDDARRCLRRLDSSPDMRVERRNEIVTRLDALKATGSAAAP